MKQNGPPINADGKQLRLYRRLSAFIGGQILVLHS
jgi:hypothetical protein